MCYSSLMRYNTNGDRLTNLSIYGPRCLLRFQMLASMLSPSGLICFGGGSGGKSGLDLLRDEGESDMMTNRVNTSARGVVTIQGFIDGIHVDPSKIEVIKNWKAPRTPSEVLSFLGLAGRLHNILRYVKSETRFCANAEGEYDCEIHYHPGKEIVVADALSGKERIKPKRVRAMNMTIKSSIKDQILASQNEASKIKAEHQRPSSLLQQPEIPKWKLERIAMDFITKLPRTNYKMDMLARLYLNEIVTRHDVPISIISDHDSRFTLQFWQSMQEALGTRESVMDFGGSYDVYLPLVEFSYNNIYHSNVRCTPFEALYGRKCRSPNLWAEVREGKSIKPEIVQETTEKILEIKFRLKAAHDRVVRFRKEGKLAPRFIDPFEITERIDPVAYRLRLPQELNNVHDTFHMKKSQAPKMIMSFIRMVENQNDGKVKQIRTNNGIEFINSELESFCDEKGISHNFSSPYTPKQNGLAKRKNKILIEAARTMLNDSILSKHFWTKADRWSRDQHIELVNIIGDPSEGMLTRSMAAKLTAASASEFLFAEFVSKIEPKKDDNGKSICQEKYIRDLLKKYEMSNSSLVKTPMVPPNNLGPDLAGKPVNATLYRGMIGSLMDLATTRPDIQFSTVLCARILRLKLYWLQHGRKSTSDPEPPIENSEAHPLKEFIIKFIVMNGKNPLNVDLKTFCKSTRLDYNQGNFIVHPFLEARKAELAKIATNEALVNKTPKPKNLLSCGLEGLPTTYLDEGTSTTQALLEGINIDPKDSDRLETLIDRGSSNPLVTALLETDAEYQVDKTQSTRFEALLGASDKEIKMIARMMCLKLEKRWMKTSNKLMKKKLKSTDASDSKSSSSSKTFRPYDNFVPVTERVLAATSYADLRAIIEEYDDDNDDHRTQTNAAMNKTMARIDKINTARAEENATLLKALNRVSETLEADSALKASLQKMDKTTNTIFGNLTDLTKLL
uniref:Integrase catalytic domain-containing protein n=1 Tax=Tanacetum cinerariifolium TaxID=118510 RepID=A0A6L2M3X8_TANCI|nr:hypothetical protein [Tanacetum cinerariifolium]